MGNEFYDPAHVVTQYRALFDVRRDMPRLHGLEIPTVRVENVVMAAVQHVREVIRQRLASAVEAICSRT
jgi:hypothetical protein